MTKRMQILLGVLRSACRSQSELVLENLALRQQLATFDRLKKGFPLDWQAQRASLGFNA